MTMIEALNEEILKSSCEVTVLPVDNLKVEQAKSIYKLDDKSSLGEIVTLTGGIICDKWVRIFGSGDIDFVEKNAFLKPYGMIVVAEDITGGLFSINAENMVHYFAPDTLEWEELGIKYSDFVFFFVLGGKRVEKFYELYRLDNWQTEIKNIKSDEGLLYIPFLWSKEIKKVKSLKHKIVPIEEIQKLQLEMMIALNGGSEE